MLHESQEGKAPLCIYDSDLAMENLYYHEFIQCGILHVTIQQEISLHAIAEDKLCSSIIQKSM